MRTLLGTVRAGACPQPDVRDLQRIVHAGARALSFLEQVILARSLLAESGRVSQRALRRQFELDDETLEDLVEELVDVQQVARLEGKILVWVGSEVPGASSNTQHPAPDTALPPPPEAAPPTAEAPRGERRQLTVLFCDLVDSTRLAASIDPEDWREIVGIYHQAAAQVVERFEGHVAEYLGDGVLAYFGHPIAHEDDAERGVRTGLGIVSQMEGLNASLPPAADSIELQVRIGVHTGPVVLGAMGYDQGSIRALGETTNLAARLQDQARPNTVVMSPQTRRLVQGVFVTHDRGLRELKGIPEPVRVIEVERISGVRSHLDVLAAAELTPLIGRDQELGLFEDRFAQAGEGRGQAVLVNGEAGIGKSRTIHAFRERLQDRPHSWLECRCSPYTQDSALRPILDLIQQALVFRPEDPAAVQTTALERGLEASGFDLAPHLPLLTEMHGLPLPEGYQALKLAPEGKRMKSLALLVEWVLRLARAQPLVLLVEDLHWVDPSTLEWLGSLLDQVATSQVLLVLTHRPDFEPPWSPKGHATPIGLSRMTRAQLAELVRSSAKGRELPEEWLEQIIRRSDGVPLFAEELTRTVLETNPDVPAGAEVPTLHIPETLQDSLMARLDALGPVKELAQLAAVLGREFDYELLLQVSPLREDALQAALASGVRDELFYQRGAPPSASYLFKHALIRDAAYQSLLRSQRRRYHLHVAETMLARSPLTVEQHPERVAQHLAEGGDAERAIPLLMAAARLATEGSSHAEAEAQLRRAIALLPDAPSGAPAFELDLYDALAATALSTHGHGSDEFGRIAGHLQGLIDACSDHPTVPWALWKLVNFYRDTGQLDTATTMAQKVSEAGERLEDDDLVVVGAAAQLFLAGLTGRFSEANSFLHQLGGFDTEAEVRRAAKFGTSGVLTNGGAIAALWKFCLGYPVQAIEWSEEGIRHTRLLDHPLTSAISLILVGYLRLFTREYAECTSLCEEAGGIARENGLLLWMGISALGTAAARTALGDPQGSELFAAVLESGQAGLRGGIPMILSAGVQIQRGCGQPDAALETLESTLSTFTPVGQVFWHAELHRLCGEILCEEKNDLEAAEASFKQALDYARKQGAKGLELRAATSYARMLRDRGHPTEAQALLTPVYEWFTEGHDLPDLVDAKALLDEVA